MATLTNNTNWEKTFTITASTGSIITLDTDNKFVEKDIKLTFVPQSATPAFDGGTISGTAAATYTNCSTTSTDISGVKVVASATANRSAVLYNGAVNGWVTRADNANASSAVNNQALTSTFKYITGVTINTGKNFNITIPNGSTTPTLTLNFAVDANGNVVVT